jgi:hypothetical protein
MQTNKWWLPLLGLAFAAVLAVSFAFAGEPPDASHHSAASIVRFYTDNEKNLQISFFVGAFAAVLLVYFFSYIRSRLELAPGETGFLTRVLSAGVIMFVAGAAIDTTLEVAMVEAAGKVPPSTILTLQAFWDNDFVPMAVGIVLIASSVALSTLLHGGLPKWLGWLMAIIAVVAMTPWGFFALPGMGLWIVLASIVLTIDERKVATTA